jgi:hypothetical protein
LINYSKQLEVQVSKDVDDEWKAVAARNKELRNYKLVTAAKIVAVALAIAGSIAALIATAGADVISALGLVNAAANLAAQFHRECMDLCKQHDRVADMMTGLNDTVREDLHGFKDIAKSVAADASPALGRFITSTKTVETEIKSLKMKYIQAEKEADDTVGKINASLDKISKINKGGIDAKAYVAIQDLEKQIDQMLNDLVFTRKILSESEKEVDGWSQDLKAWNARNPVKANIKTASGVMKVASSLGAVAGAVIKTVTAVKSLLGH